jgi:hypothetical protein
VKDDREEGDMGVRNLSLGLCLSRRKGYEQDLREHCKERLRRACGQWAGSEAIPVHSRDARQRQSKARRKEVCRELSRWQGLGVQLVILQSRKAAFHFLFKKCFL